MLLQMVLFGSFLWLSNASWASLVAQRLKRLPGRQETRVRSLSREDPWRREWQPTPVLLLGESHGRGAWWDTVHRVPKSQTWLSDFTHFTNASWYIYYTHHIFFIHSSVDRHLGCFHVWASVNSIAVKIGKYVSFWISFIWICPGVEMQDHMVTLFLV